MEKLEARLELGFKRYGHGVRVNDDTREWGTKDNSWMEMAEEEFLDAIIYVTADYIRNTPNHPFKNDFFSIETSRDDNDMIIHIIENYTRMEPCRHKTLICTLLTMV